MSDTTATTTKPGYKTTEFWLSVLATLLGFVMASGVMDNASSSSPAAKIVGGIVAVLATLGYSASRAKVKTSATESFSTAEGSGGGTN